MNKAQRIVVWIVASLLSLVSIGFGYRRGVAYNYGVFEWQNGSAKIQYNSILWFVIIPIVLMGAAAFLHFMRHKE